MGVPPQPLLLPMAVGHAGEGHRQAEEGDLAEMRRRQIIVVVIVVDDNATVAMSSLVARGRHHHCRARATTQR